MEYGDVLQRLEKITLVTLKSFLCQLFIGFQLVNKVNLL